MRCGWRMAMLVAEHESFISGLRAHLQWSHLLTPRPFSSWKLLWMLIAPWRTCCKLCPWTLLSITWRSDRSEGSPAWRLVEDASWDWDSENLFKIPRRRLLRSIWFVFQNSYSNHFKTRDWMIQFFQRLQLAKQSPAGIFFHGLGTTSAATWPNFWQLEEGSTARGPLLMAWHYISHRASEVRENPAGCSIFVPGWSLLSLNPQAHPKQIENKYTLTWFLWRHTEYNMYICWPVLKHW